LKIKIAVIAFICLNISVLRGQNIEPPLNSIDISRVIVKNDLNHSFYFGGSLEELQKAFGKTVIIQPKDKSEMTGLYYYSYINDGLEVSFENNELEGVNLSNNSITIKNSKYSFVLNEIAYNVGDKINKITKYFPDSFKNSEVNPDPDRQHLFIGIQDKDILLDGNICIEYNKEGFITEFWVGWNES
jgi:hypothetical protein